MYVNLLPLLIHAKKPHPVHLHRTRLLSWYHLFSRAVHTVRLTEYIPGNISYDLSVLPRILSCCNVHSPVMAY